MIRVMLESFTQSALYQVRVIEALRTSPKNNPHHHCCGKASVGSETVNSLVFRQCHEIRVIRNYPCAKRTARSCKPLVNTRRVPVETASPLPTSARLSALSVQSHSQGSLFPFVVYKNLPLAQFSPPPATPRQSREIQTRGTYKTELLIEEGVQTLPVGATRLRRQEGKRAEGSLSMREHCYGLQHQSCVVHQLRSDGMPGR